MRPRIFDMDPIDVDDDGIAEAQQLGAAGDLTLNGALCDLGTAARFDIGDAGYSSGIGGVRIGIASTGNLSGVAFTVTGLDQDGDAATEAITGPNNSTVQSTTFWSQITAIAADGAVGTDVTVGTVDEIVSRTFPLDWRSHEAATVAVSGLSGTCQFDIEETFDGLGDGAASLAWLVNQSDKSADFSALLTLHARAVRLRFDSYSSGAELQFHVLTN